MDENPIVKVETEYEDVELNVKIENLQEHSREDSITDHDEIKMEVLTFKEELIVEDGIVPCHTTDNTQGELSASMSRARYHYSEYQIMEAISNVRNGTPLRKAARMFHVPYNILRDKLSGRTQEGRKIGRDSYLSTETEQKLAEVMSCKLYTDEGIDQVLNALDSEDGFDASDDDSVADPTFSLSYSDSSSEDEVESVPVGITNKENISVPSTSSNNNAAAEVGTVITITENDFIPNESNGAAEVTIVVESNEREKGTQSGLKKTKIKRSLVWKNKNLIISEDQQQFKGKGDLPSHIANLETPYEFFLELFPESLVEYITSQTLLYSVQKDPSKPLDVTKEDIRKYLGICLVMSYVHVPCIRNYWSDSLGNKLIMETMPINHFEKIRKFLHFSNNDSAEPGHDRLFKVRPIIDKLRKNYQKIPMEECLSVDEQMCPTKCHSYLKQYIPSKPHKWGFKFFVLCGVSGYAYDFEIYTGQENDDCHRLGCEPDLGASSNVVVRLCREIPRNCNYKLYFDNYYTSIDLMVYLANEGIYSLGTIKRNRIRNSKMPSDSDMKKMGRGASIEMMTTIDSIDISCVAWQDNRLVMLLSTLAGELPLSVVERFDRKQKKGLAISCPAIVKHYNKHMGGVDLLDSLLGRYNNRIRSKKWYFRIFYHLLDMTVVNAWLLFRRVQGNTIKLSDFRANVAEGLCKIGNRNVGKRGRPSIEVEPQLQAKKKRRNAAHMPVKNVRLDNVGHWPDWKSTRQRCKLPLCKALTYIHCSKCGTALCLNKDKNCFTKFHTT